MTLFAQSELPPHLYVTMSSMRTRRNGSLPSIFSIIERIKHDEHQIEAWAKRNGNDWAAAWQDAPNCAFLIRAADLAGVDHRVLIETAYACAKKIVKDVPISASDTSSKAAIAAVGRWLAGRETYAGVRRAMKSLSRDDDDDSASFLTGSVVGACAAVLCVEDRPADVGYYAADAARYAAARESSSAPRTDAQHKRIMTKWVTFVRKQIPASLVIAALSAR